MSERLPSDLALRVRGLGKLYQGRTGWWSRLTGSSRAPGKWALRGVGFELPRGKVLTVLGSNGSGKSTLLKLVGRVLEPTEGRVWSRGRIASLLELGCGFHPEMSGRENLYFTAALLGETKSAISGSLESILHFSGLDPAYLDRPVRTYSSGMRMRLAFSVVTHLNPDILLLDEALSVGDLQFRLRASRKIRELADSGCGVLAATHNTLAARDLSDQALYLKSGEALVAGHIDDAISLYLNEKMVSGPRARAEQLETLSRRPNGPVRAECLQVMLTNARGEPTTQFGSNEPIRVQIDYQSGESASAQIAVLITDENGREVLISQNTDGGVAAAPTSTGSHRASCILPADTFGSRRYYLGLRFVFGDPTKMLCLDQIMSFEVDFKNAGEAAVDYWWGWTRPQLQWEHESLPEVISTQTTAREAVAPSA